MTTSDVQMDTNGKSTCEVWRLLAKQQTRHQQARSPRQCWTPRLSTKLEGQSKCITETEQRVSEGEGMMTGLDGRLAEAEREIKVMAYCMGDMENGSKQDNICVLNLKEGTEGKRPITFFETWLPDAKSHIKIDRAHCSLGLRGMLPRLEIIKLQNSGDKPRITAAVRQRPNLEYEGQRIFIHQDLSTAVRERRQAFSDVSVADWHALPGYTDREPQWHRAQVWNKKWCRKLFQHTGIKLDRSHFQSMTCFLFCFS